MGWSKCTWPGFAAVQFSKRFQNSSVNATLSSNGLLLFNTSMNSQLDQQRNWVTIFLANSWLHVSSPVIAEKRWLIVDTHSDYFIIQHQSWKASTSQTSCCSILVWVVVRNTILTHWARVTQICVGNLTIIGSDNSLSPGRLRVIIWTNVGILLIRQWRTNFTEILIKIHTFSFNTMHLKMSSVKRRPFCLGLKMLKTRCAVCY